jgi:hypothetical protein
MAGGRSTDFLTILLGVLYIVTGIAETTRAVVSGDGGIPFWFGSLVGGGALILLGHVLRRRVLVTVGCLAGVLATAWTIVVPVIALIVIVAAWRSTGEASSQLDDGRR